jgi:hypothetical protein
VSDRAPPGDAFKAVNETLKNVAATVLELSDNHRRFSGLLENLVDTVHAGQAKLRADLIERMDRLQNALTAREDETDLLLGMVAQAERDAKSAFQQASDGTTLMTLLPRRLRRLEDQVRELRERDGSGN